MKRAFATLMLMFIVAASSAANDSKQRIRVYAFNEDSDAGFEDDTFGEFAEQLSKQAEKKKSLTLEGVTRENAQVTLELIETEETNVESKRMMLRTHWGASKNRARATVMLRIADFEKEITAEETDLGEALEKVAKKSEEWIRKNSKKIHAMTQN